MAECRGIEKRSAGRGRVGLHRADDGGHVADDGDDLGEGIGNVAHEAAFEQKIARRVSADDELRENNQFGALRDEGLVGGDDFTAITGEVADGRVELGKAKAHGRKERKAWTRFGEPQLTGLAAAGPPTLCWSANAS